MQELEFCSAARRNGPSGDKPGLLVITAVRGTLVGLAAAVKETVTAVPSAVPDCVFNTNHGELLDALHRHPLAVKDSLNVPCVLPPGPTEIGW